MRIFLLGFLTLVWSFLSAAENARPQLVLLTGHTAEITSLTVSPDGKMLASGGADGAAKIWNLSTNSLQLSLPHDAPVLAVRFENTDVLLTATASGAVSFWSSHNGVRQQTILVPNIEATAAALSPDGKTVAFALADHKIVFHEATTGRVLRAASGHPTRVLEMAFSPDGKTLASVSEAFREKPASEEFAPRAGDVRLWDAADGELQRTLRGHALSVRGLAWSPDGKRLSTAGESGRVVVWNADDGSRIRELNVSEGQGRATGLAFSADGAQLATGWRGGVRLWDLKTESPNALWSIADAEPMHSVAFAGNHVIAGGRDGALKFIGVGNAANGNAVIENAREGVVPLTVIKLSPDGSMLACASKNGDIALWDAKSGALKSVLRGPGGAATSLVFDPSGKYLLSAGRNAGIRVWNLANGALIKEWRETLLTDAIALSPDGKLLATTDGGQTGIGPVKIWDFASVLAGAPKVLQTLSEPSGQVRSLAFAPDGATLAAATTRGHSWGQVLVWDAANWKLLRREFTPGARSVAFSADGKKLAAAGAVFDENDDYNFGGDSVPVWNARTLELQSTLTKNSRGAGANDVAFLPERRLATASRDGAIRVWNAEGEIERVLQGHHGSVVSLVIGNDGKTLVSAGNDGTVRFWDVASGRERAAFVRLPEAQAGQDNWIALTPEGFYHDSPGAGRFLSWRVGADEFPVEAYQKNYRRAEMVARALAGETITAGTPFSEGEAIPPRVAITLPRAGQKVAETGALPVEVAATDDRNVRQIQLFANGRPVAAQSVETPPKPLEVGAKPLEIGAKPLEIGAKPIPSHHELSWQIRLQAPLPPADSAGLTLKALVTDGDGLQGWDEIRVARDGVAASGDLHVLSIGVSQYANPAYNLKFAAADALAFAALWPPLKGKLFRNMSVKSLADAGASASAVSTALAEIARAAGPEDTVVIFLSGHGVQKRDAQKPNIPSESTLESSEFYFATHDVDLERVATTAVPWTAFQRSLSASRARRVVLFLDACHSGQALGGRRAGNEDMAAQLVKGAGAVVFASSLGTQVSFELEALRHGAFTQALLEGIGQGKADLDAGAGHDGIVNVEELLTFLRARVPQLTDGAQMPSCPLLRDFGEPFPLARVP